MPPRVILHPPVITYPPGFRVAFEQEFCTTVSLRKFRDEMPEEVASEYTVGTDLSLCPTLDNVHQLEVRTLFPSSHVDVDILRKLLTYIKAVNKEAPRSNTVNNQSHAFTTRTCGLHVHISTPSEEKSIAAARLIDERIVQRYSPFKERESYCDPKYRSRRGRRYNAIRQVDRTHFEVRIFNGTLKLRGITHWLSAISDIGFSVYAMDAVERSTIAANGWPRAEYIDDEPTVRLDTVFTNQTSRRRPTFIDEMLVTTSATSTYNSPSTRLTRDFLAYSGQQYDNSDLATTNT